MPDWILFLPILFLPVGALGFALAAPGVPLRVRPWLPLIFLVTEISAVLANIAPTPRPLVLSSWEPASFSIAFQIDGIALLLLLLVFVPLLVLWLVAPSRTPFDLFPIFVLTAAITLIASVGLTTVYFAWTFLDLAIFVWRLARDIEHKTALRAFVVSQLAALGLFAGSLFIGTAHSNEGILLIALAFWARLGLFPFHWILPTRGADLRDLWIARGVPLLAASSLWLRWWTLRVAAPREWIAVLAVLALSTAVIGVWHEEQPSRAIGVSTSHAIALVPLAIAFGSDAALAFALWLTLGAAFAIALFEMTQRWHAENRNRWGRVIWFAGLSSLAGLPLTPAFLGRVGLYVSLWESGRSAWLLLLVFGAATTLILTPLWNLGLALESAEPRNPTRIEYVGLGVMSLAFAVLSLAPMWIAHALASNVRDSAEAAILRVIWTNNTVGVAIGFGMLIAPIVLSFFLRSVAHNFHPRAGSFPERVISLNWLERVLTGVGYEMGAAARNISVIAEANPTVWILLVTLWIAIFVLVPR